MRRYNIADTKLAEAVFDKLGPRGWIRGCQNHAVDSGHVCPCGSESYRRAAGSTRKPALPAVPVQNLLCMVAIRGQRTGRRAKLKAVA